MIWRHGNRAALLKPRCLARYVFERFEKVGCVLGEASQVMSSAQLADKTRSMPSSATSKLLAFKKYDICATTQGQVIGNTAADDASADDYDASICR
jgi:hypothetical protein